MVSFQYDNIIIIAHCSTQISKGGMAESTGKLEVGQRILEVDTHSLLGASHVEAVHILRQTENTVRLLVCDGYGIRSNGKSCDYHVIIM